MGQIPVFLGVSDRKNDVILTYAYQELLSVSLKKLEKEIKAKEEENRWL